MVDRKLRREQEVEAKRLLGEADTPAETLAVIAQAFPELRTAVAEHPQAYPGLIEWIAENPAPASPRRNTPLMWAAAAAVIALVAAGTTGAIAFTQRADNSQAASAVGSSSDADGGSGGTGNASHGTGSASDGTGSGSSSSATDDESGGTDTALDGGDRPPVIFILDASGSMVRETSAGRTRMDDARDALETAIGDLPASTRAGLLVFGTGTGNSEEEREAGCSDVVTLAQLGTLDRSAMTDAVSGVTESGFTPIGPALREAAAMLPADSAVNIVLISDGVDTCSPPPACETASQLTSQNPNLAIHVVGFAVDDDEEVQQQLQCIAGVGRGTFSWAGSADQLAARLLVAADPTRSATSLTATGTRGVLLGMTLDEVQRAVGGAEVIDQTVRGGIEIIWVDCGWGTAELHDGIVVSIRTADDGVTAEGVTVGDDLDTAVVLYGEPVESASDDDGTYSTFRTGSGGSSAYRIYTDAARSTIERIVLCRCLPFSGTLASFADWDVSFDGVGPVRLGMTVDEVMAAVPEFAAPDSSDSAVYWTPLGADVPFTIVLTGDGHVHDITVGISGYAEEVPDGSQLPQARGIRVGDTGRTAIWGFPGGTGITIMFWGMTSYQVADRRGHTLTFDVNRSVESPTIVEDLDDAVVIGITVGDQSVPLGWS